MADSHQRVEAAIKAFAKGEIVVVTDDDERENEGDLFVAASHCTPEKMAFIIRNTSGIVCAPLGAEQARRLHLEPMVADNEAPLGTAFTVSVDVRHGLTTGISADERCNTVRALANGNSGPADFVRPGHVFPLVAREDLCRLASLPPVGVLAELMNDNGSVMRGPEVAAFAQKHKLAQVSIAELIAYRQNRDKLVERVGEFHVASEIGTLNGYAYVTPFDRVHSRQPEAGSSYSCATAQRAYRSLKFRMKVTQAPTPRVPDSGAKSDLVRRFSRTSGYPRSGC